MEFLEIPEFPILHGEEAINAINDFIKELEEQKSRKLTEKQAKTLIKFAKGLITAIEAETHPSISRTDMSRRSTFSANLERLFTFFKRH